jgi:hypothetical protein
MNIRNTRQNVKSTLRNYLSVATEVFHHTIRIALSESKIGAAFLIPVKLVFIPPYSS